MDGHHTSNSSFAVPNVLFYDNLKNIVGERREKMLQCKWIQNLRNFINRTLFRGTNRIAHAQSVSNKRTNFLSSNPQLHLNRIEKLIGVHPPAFALKKGS